MENNAYRLPDSYGKNTDSNNYKLLELNRLESEDARADIEAIDKSLDIHETHGTTMDLYGDLLGRTRGQLDDKQYLFVLLAQIGRLMSTGEINAILNLMSQFLQINIEDIEIEEVYPPKIKLVNVPFDQINAAGFSVGEVQELVSHLLPAGVSIASASFEKSLAFFVYFAAGACTQKRYDLTAWREKQIEVQCGFQVGAAVAAVRKTYIVDA